MFKLLYTVNTKPLKHSAFQLLVVRRVVFIISEFSIINSKQCTGPLRCHNIYGTKNQSTKPSLKPHSHTLASKHYYDTSLHFTSIIQSNVGVHINFEVTLLRRH